MNQRFAAAGLAAAVSLIPWITASPSGAQETFVDTVEVNVVNVEVFVSDKKGNPITGLTVDDFELLEDGQPVQISNFFVASGAGAEPAAESPAAAPGAAAAVAAGAPAATAPVPKEQRLSVVIFVDNQNITPQNRNRVLKAFSGSLWFNLKPSDRVMVVSYDGAVTVRRELTGDVRQVVATLEEMTTGSSRGLHAELDRRAILKSIEQVSAGTALGGGGPSGGFSEGSLESEARGIYSTIKVYSERRYDEVRTTLEHIKAFVEPLAGLPGRKAIVYISEGLPLRPGEALYHAWQNRFADLARDIGAGALDAFDLDASAHLREVGEQANANRVTFYSILARAGGAHMSISAEQGSLDLGALDSPGGGRAWSAGLDAIDSANHRATMQLMSDMTGGQATLSLNAIGSAVRRLNRDFDTYYSLGYSPALEADGKNHKLEVKVRDKRLRVRHRGSYRSKTSDERMSDMTKSALLFDAEDNPLQVLIEFGDEKQDEKGRYLVPVIVKIPIANLLLMPQEHFHEGQVSIFVAARDDRGRMSPVQKMPMPIRVPNNKLLTALGQVAGYRLTLLMRPAEHAVCVGVRDELGGVESMIRVDHTPGQAATFASAG